MRANRLWERFDEVFPFAPGYVTTASGRLLRISISLEMGEAYRMAHIGRRKIGLGRLIVAVRVGLIVCIVAAAYQPAHASFHFGRIVEICQGIPQHPTAQYIIIMPYSNSQHVFANVQVSIYNAAGIRQTDFATFVSNLPSTTTNQRSILVATAAAQTIFGITPDQVATGTLPASGLVCFLKGAVSPTVADCVSYGDYTGSTLAGGSQAGPPAATMPSGLVLRRDLGADGTLQALDDTNNSALDFRLSAPTPENFARTRISELTITDIAGSVTLTWTNTAGSYTIHKMGDSTTIRDSLAVDTSIGTSWMDPTPDQFPGVTYYLVKP